MSLKSIVSKQRSLNLDELTSGKDEPKQNEEISKQSSVKQFSQIPPKSLFNQPLTLSGYSDLRKAKKEELKLNDFVSQVEEVLNYFDVEGKKYDFSIILWVCNQAENYFSKPKSGENKKKAVIAVCKKYFNNDELLVSQAVQSVVPLVSRSSVLSRCYFKSANFFYSMLSRLKK